MKINSSITPVTTTGVKEGQKRAPTPAGAGAAQQQPQAAQDNVQLSAAAKLQSGSLESVSVVDAAKVEAIKQAIAEGRFAINPEAIADGLIATAKDLVKGKD